MLLSELVLYDKARTGSSEWDPFGEHHDTDYFLVSKSEVTTPPTGFKFQMRCSDGYVVIRTVNGEQIDCCIASLRWIDKFFENPENVSKQGRNGFRSRFIYGVPSIRKSPIYKRIKKHLNEEFLKTSEIFFQQYIEDQKFTNFDELTRLGEKEATKRFCRATYMIRTFNLPPRLFREVNDIYHILRERRAVGIPIEELYGYWSRIKEVLNEYNKILFGRNSF